MVKDYKAYLSHILDSIVLIENFTLNLSFEEFEKDRKTIENLYKKGLSQLFSHGMEGALVVFNLVYALCDLLTPYA